ncbi:MAG: beta-lactamase family protein [Alphaproteobacteria bacterium]|nr:beta-lactamase family protein [Alphaproteobacteria bacterium]HRW29519.1 serine hydrolase domain-containing protein [Emcibacteraceae bacterium]
MKTLQSIFLFFLISVSSAWAQNGLPANFDETVLSNMEKWHAPGLGLAIVKDGKTVLTKGYGVKSIKSGAPADKNTLFQAGSTTKAFAAMSIAMLIDQGKVTWDDPIIKHIPEFKMKDKYVQNNLTIRDALSHVSGVSPLSNINMFLGLNIDETWALMAETGQQATLRQKWDYNNTTFALAGRIVERLSGMRFHDFVRTNILDPLGMDHTRLLDVNVENDPDRADAHQYYKGKEYQIPYPYIEYTQSAGMINSTPEDMAKWMKFLLAKGKWNGKQLVSSELIEEMMKPQALLDPEGMYPAATTYDQHYYAYGLAWFVHDFRGHKMVMHTGSIYGMSAIIGLFPDDNIGVYIFINGDHIEYRHALMYQVLDNLLGNEDTDWSDKIYPLYNSDKNSEKPEIKLYPDITEDALIGDYVLEGSYPLYIKEYGKTLTAHVGRLMFELVRENDRYRVISPETREIPWDNYLEMETVEGVVTSVTLNGLSYLKK